MVAGLIDVPAITNKQPVSAIDTWKNDGDIHNVNWDLCALEYGKTIFMIPGEVIGQKLAVLLDSGAGLSFISPDVVRRLGLNPTPVDAIQVRLGNAGVCSVTNKVTFTINLSDTIALEIEAFVLGIPNGIDAIIGMPALATPGLWMEPATKRLKLLHDQNDHELAFMSANSFEKKCRSDSPAEGIHLLHAVPDATADGDSSEVVNDYENLPKAQFNKLLSLHRQGKLNGWESYSDPSIRGKHCSYASQIARERTEYCSDHYDHYINASPKSLKVQPKALIFLRNRENGVFLTQNVDGNYGLPTQDAANIPKKARRVQKAKQKQLKIAANYAFARITDLGPDGPALKPFMDCHLGCVFAMDRPISDDEIEPHVNGKFFSEDNLPANMVKEHRTLLTADVHDTDENVFLCELFVNPDVDKLMEADEKAMKVVTEHMIGKSSRRLTVTTANNMFDSMCSSTRLSGVRRFEAQHRRTLSRVGSRYVPADESLPRSWGKFAYPGSATGAMGPSDGNSNSIQQPGNRKQSVSFAEQVDCFGIIDDPECATHDGGILKASQTLFIAQPEMCSQPNKDTGTGKDGLDSLESTFAGHFQQRRAEQLMTLHAESLQSETAAAWEEYVPLYTAPEDSDDWERLKHICCKIAKSKFSDSAEMPRLDASTVDEYLAEHYPIRMEDIDDTIASEKEWVKDMIDGKFGKFTCFDPVERFVSNPEHEKAHMHQIPGKNPRKAHRHRTPVHLMETLKQWHLEMYKRGFIVPIQDAAHLSPVLVIKKPDTAEGKSRGYRFVVSMVEQNETLEGCENFTPTGDEIFDRLKAASVITTTDLSDGYWVVELDASSSRLCAFQSEYGSWAWRVLPQGAKPSAGIFNEWHTRLIRRHGMLAGHEKFVDLDAEYERQINTGVTPALERGDIKAKKSALSEDLKWHGDGFVEVMLDDALVHSKSIEDHRTQLLFYLKVCSAEKLPIKLAKCKFFCRYARYLGIVVGNGHVMVDPLKVMAIMKMVRPKNASELKGFLGAAGWMRKFIPAFAARQQVLNKLLKKGVIFAKQWDDECTEAWLGLKKSLMTYPALRCFNKDLPVTVYTDASQFHCGGAAVQFYPDPDDPNTQVPVVIAYHSRSFNEAESKYSSQEREMAGVVSCCLAFKHYLINSTFDVRIVSDHQSLQYAQLSKIQTNRIGRWTMLMSQFQFKIFYAPGATHHMADVLSRALEIPEQHWRRRKPIDNEDDFLGVPFMAHWPDVQYGYQCAMMMPSDLRSDGGEESTGMSSGAHANASSTTSAHTFSCSTGYDEKLDDPAYYLRPHEIMIFGYMSQRPIPNDKVFRESDYLKCPDFGQIYAELADNDDDLRRARRVILQKLDGQAKVVRRYNQADLKQAMKSYILDGGYLYKADAHYGYVLCVPDAEVTDGYGEELHGKVTLRRLLFEELHSSPGAGHRGVAATEKALRKRYHWPKMCDHSSHGQGNADSVSELIRRCPTCQMAKTDRSKPQGWIQPVQVPLAPAQSYNVDLIVGLPKIETEQGDMSKVFVVVDRFSTRTWLLPTLTNVTAPLLGELFTDEICLKAGRGIPLEIISDRDPLMTSGFWRGLFKRFGTELRFTQARSQQANGQVERMIGTIGDMLRCNINFNQRNWLELLPHIQFVLNATIKVSQGGMCPMMAEMGITPLLPIDLLSNLAPGVESGYSYKGRANVSDPVERIAAIANLRVDIRKAMLEVREKMAEEGNRHRRQPDEQIQVGAEVWLSVQGLSFSTLNNTGMPKLLPKRYGPFEVLEQVSTNSFRLDLGSEALTSGVHDVFPVRLLRLYVHDSNRRRPKRIDVPQGDDDTEYEISEILAERTKGDHREYLVHWKGYSARFGSEWINESELTRNAIDVLSDFVKRNGSVEAKEALEQPPHAKKRRKA